MAGASGHFLKSIRANELCRHYVVGLCKQIGRQVRGWCFRRNDRLIDMQEAKCLNVLRIGRGGVQGQGLNLQE